MNKDTQTQLSSITIALHWIVAVFIIGLIALGLYMEGREIAALYMWHKSLGVIVLAFILTRVVWRVMNGWPEPVRQYQPWEQKLSKVIHWVLIVGMVLFPVSGMLMSGYGGYGITVFGLELVGMNLNPVDSTKVMPVNETLAGIGHTAHGALGNIFIAAISLHLLGALKHHIMDKDNTLKRMLGR